MNEKYAVHLSLKNSKHLRGLSFVLVCELWMGNFDSMLALVKKCIIDLWEVRKVKLYGEQCSTQPQSQSSAGNPRDGTVVGGQRRGKFHKFSHSEVSYLHVICYEYVRGGS